ncbi:MBL fold metallo-hydrolase [Streptomyces krungchingensis]
MNEQHMAGRTTQVADGVYAYIQPDGTWQINNTAFLVGSQGVVSIDTCSTQRRTLEYLTAIRKITDRPVRTLINTHHHGDHTNGNYLLPGATVIAHHQTRSEMLRHGLQLAEQNLVWGEVDWGDVRQEPPFVTFSDRLTVHVDDTEGQVVHAGAPAHTTNDSYLWLPQQKVLICGDLIFNGGMPFVLFGSVQGAIDVLEQRLLPLGAETIIPGHGPVCGPEVITDVLDYLYYVQHVAEQGRSAGLTPLQAAQRIGSGSFAGLSDPERLVGNLHRAYAELDGHPLGSPIDIPAAMIDMVVYNDGKPLRCIA